MVVAMLIENCKKNIVEDSLSVRFLVLLLSLLFRRLLLLLLLLLLLMHDILSHLSCI